MSDCFPDPICRCCECQGIHCFMAHPGHSHRTALELPAVPSPEGAGSPPEAKNHQFWCPRHGEYFIADARACSAMTGRCPQCIEADHAYNEQNVGGALGPAAFTPAYRCNCQRENKRIATTGMFA